MFGVDGRSAWRAATRLTLLLAPVAVIGGSLVGIVVLPESSVAAPVGATRSLTGAAYRDYDADGVRDAGEPGQGGVTVSAMCIADSGPDSALNTADDVYASDVTTTTAADGRYAFGTTLVAPATWNAAANGTWSPPTPGAALHASNCRVVFSAPDAMPFLKPGAMGGSLVQFVNLTAAGGTNVNASLNNPADYSNASSLPYLVTSNLLPGTSDAAVNPEAATWASILRMSYDWSVTADYTIEAETSDVGATWGIAVQPSTKTIFTSAFVKRHVGMGPAGPDAIYALGPDAPAAWSTPLTAVDADGGAVQSDAARGLTAAATESDDDLAFSQVGKLGWGDLDISEDGTTLYAVNLMTAQVQPIVIATKTAGSPLSPPSAPCVNGAARPWALEVRDGLLYVGVVCDAASGTAADLAAFVYAYNPSATTIGLPGSPAGLAAGSWSANLIEEATPGLPGLQLDYTKGCAQFAAGSGRGCGWQPWDDSYTDAEYESGEEVIRPSPMLTDIEIDDDGSMMLAFGDRVGHQFGATNLKPQSTDQANLVSAISGGDMLRAAAPVGGSTWTIENDGSVARGAALGGGVIVGDTVNGEGPGGGEVYAHETWADAVVSHAETSLGSTVKVAGRSEFVLGVIDPIDPWTGGLQWMPISGAAPTDQTTLYGGTTADRFGKANGLGDIEVLSDLAPIEIGNRVWSDYNLNGTQDPGEPGISGVVVTLYAADGTTPITTVTTDVNGTYLFSSKTRADVAGRNYAVSALTPGAQVVIGAPLVVTIAGASTPLTIRESAVAQDQLDSDVNRTTGKTSTLTLGAAGENDHTFDIGYGNAPAVGSITVVKDVPDTDSAAASVVDFEFEITTTNCTLPIDPYIVHVTGEGTGTFSNLPLASGGLSCQYSVEEINVPSGWEPTGANPQTATLDGADSAPTLLTFTNRRTAGAGFSIGNTIWYDLDDDGGIDDGEPRAPAGTAVRLLDLLGNPVASTTTDANGLYLFGGLIRGTYIVEIDQPAGYRSSTPTEVGDVDNRDHGDPGTNSAGSPVIRSAPVTLDEGTEPSGENPDNDPTTPDSNENLSVDFGLVPQLTLGNQVWHDLNRNGRIDPLEPAVPDGVKINLLTAAGAPVLDGAGNPATTTTVAGNYLFVGLLVGTYIVEVDPSNFAVGGRLEHWASSPGQTTDDTDGADHGAPGADGGIRSGVIGLVFGGEPTGETPSNDADTPDANSNLTADFGLYLLGSLGDLVWLDIDRDGIQDPGETGVDGVTVRLFDINGTLVGTTVTGGGGNYRFADLIPGDYTVEFAISTLPPGHLISTSGAPGSTESDDSDGDATSGRTTVFSVTPGGNEPRVDLGLHPAEVDLAVIKTVEGDVVANRDSTWKLNVTNQGRDAETGTITVTDSLPAELTFVSATGIGWNCVAGGQVVSCTTEADLPGGGSLPTITVIARVAQGATGEVANRATVKSPGAEAAEANNASLAKAVISQGGSLPATGSDSRRAMLAALALLALGLVIKRLPQRRTASRDIA